MLGQDLRRSEQNGRLPPNKRRFVFPSVGVTLCTLLLGPLLILYLVLTSLKSVVVWACELAFVVSANCHGGCGQRPMGKKNLFLNCPRHHYVHAHPPSPSLNLSYAHILIFLAIPYMQWGAEMSGCPGPNPMKPIDWKLPPSHPYLSFNTNFF